MVEDRVVNQRAPMLWVAKPPVGSDPAVHFGYMTGCPTLKCSLLITLAVITVLLYSTSAILNRLKQNYSILGMKYHRVQLYKCGGNTPIENYLYYFNKFLISTRNANENYYWVLPLEAGSTCFAKHFDFSYCHLDTVLKVLVLKCCCLKEKLAVACDDMNWVQYESPLVADS